MQQMTISKYMATGDRADYGVTFYEVGGTRRYIRVAFTGTVRATAGWDLDQFMAGVADVLATVPPTMPEPELFQFNSANCGTDDPSTVLARFTENPTSFWWPGYPPTAATD